MNYFYYVWDPEFRGGSPEYLYGDCRCSKTGFFIIRSKEIIDNLQAIDYYVVTEYMKVGY